MDFIFLVPVFKIKRRNKPVTAGRQEIIINKLKILIQKRKGNVIRFPFKPFRIVEFGYQTGIDALLMPLLTKLINNEPLEERYHDHLLTGDKKGYKDCHIKPDLLLIYQKPSADTLVLIRLGSHAEVL